jgi:hypothetical protein
MLLAPPPRWKGALPSHNTLLAVECDGPVPAERITRALDRFLDLCPWPAARLRRPFPWGELHWAAGARKSLTRPPVRRVALAARDQIDRVVATELNTPIDPRREAPLRILTLDSEATDDGAGSFLVLTWFHPLMDARGGQNFLDLLNRCDGADGGNPWDDTCPTLVPERAVRTLKERRRIAKKSLRYLRTVAREPPLSLSSSMIPPGRACFVHKAFATPEGGDSRQTREIFWRLALVGKAMAELWRTRGMPDAPFLLPISVDQRPKGVPGSTFGSQLAFHFAQFRPSDTSDVAGLARALRTQMADAVRSGHLEANAVGIEFLKYLPLSRMLHVLPWTASGELFSFNCADLADWPAALEHCFGRRVVNVYHVPVLPPRPGVGVFFNRCGSRNNLVVSWLEGVVSREDAARIIEVVRDGMGWTK